MTWQASRGCVYAACAHRPLLLRQWALSDGLRRAVGSTQPAAGPSTRPLSLPRMTVGLLPARPRLAISRGAETDLSSQRGMKPTRPPNVAPRPEASSQHNPKQPLPVMPDCLVICAADPASVLYCSGRRLNARHGAVERHNHSCARADELTVYSEERRMWSSPAPGPISSVRSRRVAACPDDERDG